MIYYTFRFISNSPLRVECCKWEEGSLAPQIPIDRYIIYPELNSCSCVAMKRECRHVLRAKEITKTLELIAEMCRWRWDEQQGWREMFDIPYFDEFEERVFVS